MNRTVDMIRQISEILNHPVYLLDESYNVILGIDQEQLLLSKKNMNSKNLIPLRDKRGKTYYLYIKKELSNEVYQLAKLLLENCIRQLTLGDREEILKDILKEREDVDLLYRLYGATFLKAEAYSILFIRGIQEGEFNLYQIIQSLFRDCSYCTSVLLEEGIVLLIDRKLSKKQLDEVAKSIRDTVNAELYVDVMIGISEEGRGILQLRKSFMEAKESIAIGERFFMGKHIYFYEDLQLERMVLGIPIEERKKIYIELFENEMYDDIEEELYRTLEVFFQNNLHLGETARALYIHRNTLAYRLDKIHKVTGLDLRRFEDAMLFKLGWMLQRSIEIRR